MKKVGVAKVGARFRVRLRQVLQLSSGFQLENGAAFAVGVAPGFARKVLRLASGLRRPTRPIRIKSRGGEGWCSL